jgi:hypothetical protein
MSEWGPVYDQAAREWEEEPDQPEFDEDDWEDYDGPSE